MTSFFQPIVMKFGMWVYNDCENTYIYISKKLKCWHKRDCACMNDVNHDWWHHVFNQLLWNLECEYITIVQIYILVKKLKCLHKRDCACMNDVNHNWWHHVFNQLLWNLECEYIMIVKIYIIVKNSNVCTNMIVHARMMSIMTDDIMLSTNCYEILNVSI